MKTFVVIGLGRFGSALARRLSDIGHEVLAIDPSEARVQIMSEYCTHCVVANGADEEVLRSLGVRNYDCGVVAVGTNFNASLLATLALKEAGLPQIVCKASDYAHKRILLKIGADQVIIPEQEMGYKLAVQLTTKSLLDSIELSDEYSIFEVLVPPPFVGRTIRELDIRHVYNINIVAVRRVDRQLEVTPSPDLRFAEGDVLALVGRNEDIATIMAR